MQRFVCLSGGVKWRVLVMGIATGAMLAAGCLPASMTPRPGLREYEAGASMAFGSLRAHLAGGNLSSDRVDLVLDTRVAPLVHGAVYNSASRSWRWRHEMTVREGIFIDETGATFDLNAVMNGESIPGTHWVRLGDAQVKTKGGLVHKFHPVTGRLVEVRWQYTSYPKLNYAAAELSGLERTVRVEQCVDSETCSDQLTFSYDEFGCLASVVDRAGRVADYVHDAKCRTLVARDAFDVDQGLPGVRYEYIDGGLLRSTETSEGERTELEYSNDRVSVIRQPGVGDATTWNFAYRFDPDVFGMLTLVSTPRGGVWRYAIDDAYRLTRRESPEGDVLKWTWSGLRPSAFTNAAGSSWLTEYLDDDLARLELPSGEVVRWFWAHDAVDRERPRSRPLDRIVDSIGIREQRSYDGSGRLVTRVNGVLEATHFDWDALGSLVSVTTPAGRTTTLSDHGEHGHAARLVAGEIEEVRLFDAVGNLEKGSDLEGELGPGRPGLVRRRFDADRNIAEVVTIETSLTGNVISEKTTLIDHRSDGRPVRISRPYGGDETYIYDTAGRLTERRDRVDGIDRITQFSFDDEARLRRVTRPNGMETDLDWDLDGRLAAMTRRFGASPVEHVAFAYGRGRIEQVDDSAYSVSELIQYDSNGFVSSIEHPTGGRTDLAYDVRGRETGRRVFDPSYGSLLYEITRSWDEAGRLRDVRIDGNLIVERTHVAGEIRSIRTGNGLTRNFDYDPLIGEVVRTSTVRADGEVIEDTTIARGACLPTRICVDVLSSILLAGNEGESPLQNLGEEYYQLDWYPASSSGFANPGSWLRMSSRLPILSNPQGDRVQFDALGNLVAHQPRGGVASSFVFNAERNRLVSGGIDANHQFEYDESGYVTARDGVPLGWSASGKLTSIGSEVRLAWDGSGRPLSREFEGVTARYGFGGSVEVDEAGWPIVTEIEGVRVVLGTPIRRYTHHDFRGNVLFVTDEHGQALRRHVYHAFGERWVVDRDGTQRAPRMGERGFAQGLHIAGIQLLGARPYDPGTGRFMAPDPMNHVLNDFSYTRGNPIQLWDPSGLHAVQTPGMTPTEANGKTLVTAGEIIAMTGGAIVATGIGTGQPEVVAGGVAVTVLGTVLVWIGNRLQIKSASETQQPVDGGTEQAVDEGVLLRGGANCAPNSFKPRLGESLPEAAVILGLILAVLVVSGYQARV